jgi:hypothetical protein
MDEVSSKCQPQPTLPTTIGNTSLRYGRLQVLATTLTGTLGRASTREMDEKAKATAAERRASKPTAARINRTVRTLCLEMEREKYAWKQVLPLNCMLRALSVQLQRRLPN